MLEIKVAVVIMVLLIQVKGGSEDGGVRDSNTTDGTDYSIYACKEISLIMLCVVLVLSLFNNTIGLSYVIYIGLIEP